MKRLGGVALVVGLTGCSFSPSASGGAGGQPDAGSTGGGDSGSGQGATSCSVTGTVLCVDFTDPLPSATTGIIPDLSTAAAMVDATSVSAMQRGSSQAAMLGASSALTIAADPTLEVTDNLTIEMWVRPTSIGTAFYAFDHSREYSLSVDTNGAVRCTIGNGGNPVTGQIQLSANAWSHIACTYASTGLTGLTGGSSPTLAIYVNGTVDVCDNQTTSKVPTNATTLTAIGAREPTSGTALTNQLLGGVDDVHVFASVLAPAAICAHAGNTTCGTTCSAAGGG